MMTLPQPNLPSLGFTIRTSRAISSPCSWPRGRRTFPTQEEDEVVVAVAAEALEIEEAAAEEVVVAHLDPEDRVTGSAPTLNATTATLPGEKSATGVRSPDQREPVVMTVVVAVEDSEVDLEEEWTEAVEVSEVEWTEDVVASEEAWTEVAVDLEDVEETGVACQTEAEMAEETGEIVPIEQSGLCDRRVNEE